MLRQNPETVRRWKERSALKAIERRRTALPKQREAKPRQAIKQKGKQGRANDRVNSILKAGFIAGGIETCEVQRAACTGNFMLTFAHLWKRRNMLRRGQDITPEQCVAVLACVSCHDKTERLGEEEMQIELRSVIACRPAGTNARIARKILEKGVDISPVLDRLNVL